MARRRFSSITHNWNFKHSSPFGKINGKKEYINLVEENLGKILGYRFEIQDEIYEENRACVSYKAIQGDFILEVREWYFVKNNLIGEIVAYYNISEIREDRKLSSPQGDN